MKHQAASIDQSGDQQDRTADPSAEEPHQRRVGSMKFAYASGSQPLEGYTIKRGVGAGGFGEVYYATSDAGKEVALKHVQRNLDIELRGVSQCLNLKHINLVALYDIKYDEAGEGWVIMEFVPGESLKDVVDRNPNGMPHEAVNRWLSGVAAGVAYLHDHGIVHRDLKPGNLFDDEGTVKIGDYGLSKFISVSRRSGQTESVGTLHYMAPEIGRGSYGREIDIYAMGIMLHEMLTGDVPFNGESSQEIIMKHLTADPEIGDVSEPYRAVILKALAKDPEHRFRTVAEMLEPLGLSSTSTYESPSQAGFVSSDRSTPSSPDDETVYIGDEPAEEMVFDELHQRPGAEVVDAELVTTGPPDEPIAASVREGALRLRDWWNNAPIGTPLKVVVIVGVIAAVLINATWLIPVGVSLTLVYGIYWAIRAMALGHHTSPSTATLPPRVGTPGHQQRPRGPRTRRRSWYKRARADMAAKSPQQWTTELVGSLLTSAAASAVIAVVMMLIAGANVQSQFQSWAPQYLWLTIVSTLGCWAVLIPAKCWESHPGEQLLRRFGMLIFGLVLGAVACGVASLLMWNMNFDNSAALGRNFSTQLYGASGVASPKAFLASFAGLLVALRWWRQADPLRPTRISVWATASAAGAAVLLYYVCPFPHPWGVMVATTISVAVQVSAPWMTSKERSTLRRQLQGS